MLRVIKFITLFRILFGKGSIDTQRIEKMGLLAVKIAQMYAVRSDILGLEKCRELSSLYEETSPIPWEEVEAILDEHAPDDFWKEVEEVDPVPLAAASLGQVHFAQLYSGSRAVIKVIKPNSQKHFQADLRAVRFLAQLAVTFYPKLKRLADPIGTIETIARLTRTELNLENEAIGTERLITLRDKAHDLPHLRNLRFPKIYRELSSPKVLVSEFLPQNSVRKGLAEGDFTYNQLLTLFRTHGYFLFYCGEFHGDLHPGNVFYEDEHLWFIDNANIEEVDPNFTQSLLQFLAELGKGDYPQAAEVMQGLSLTPPKDASKYLSDFSQLYSGFESGKTSLTNQMMETVKLCVHAGLEFPEGAFSVIKSLMYLDGMVLECAPEANLLEDILLYLSDLS